MSYDCKSETAKTAIERATLLLNDILKDTPNYSENKTDEVIQCIFLAAMAESTKNLRYVLGC